MSGLETTRKYARVMAESAHAEGCERRLRRYRGCDEDGPHDGHEWYYREVRFDCPGICGGCMPEAERALWTRLADELDAYLDGQAEDHDEHAEHDDGQGAIW